MDSDKRQQYNRRMNGLFLCLPIEVECLVYNFLSIKELYGTLALVSRGAYELLSQAVVAIYQSHNSNNSSVSSPSVFLLYPCITLFLAAQKKLHAPLGILGRDPVLIRQFLLSGQYDAFDSILTTEAPNRQLENVIEIRHESNDEKEHQNNMIRSRIERLIREIRHSINRAQDYGGPRRDLILSRLDLQRA